MQQHVINIPEVINIKSVGVSKDFNYNSSTTKWTYTRCGKKK